LSHSLRKASSDDGNAIVEFVWLAVLLMVPLVYLMLTVFRVQSASYAVSSATREAGRVFVTAPDSGTGHRRALESAALVMHDAGLRLDPGQVRITCSATPCLTPGARVDIEIGYDTTLPFVPELFGRHRTASVHVTGRHLEVVDRYRPARP
jgi:Flp pilus assembly protein TadG